jgi:hypothetical protein
MIANYGEPKDKAKTTTGAEKLLEERPAELEEKKLRIQTSDPDKATAEEEKTSATKTTSMQK